MVGTLPAFMHPLKRVFSQAHCQGGFSGGQTPCGDLRPFRGVLPVSSGAACLCALDDANEHVRGQYLYGENKVKHIFSSILRRR